VCELLTALRFGRRCAATDTLKGKRNLKRTAVVGYVCVGQDSDPVAE